MGNAFESVGADPTADPVGGDLRRALAGLRHEDRELVSAEASEMVDLAQGVPEQLGQRPQDLVPRIVPVRVVDLLEAVHVDHQARQLRAVAAGELELVRERVVEAATVVESGERVRDREHLDRAQHRLELRVAAHQFLALGLCSQGGEDPRVELRVVEGLGQVVVRADVQTFDSIRDLAPHREHDDRDVARLFVQLEPATHREAVHVAHHDVEQHEVRRGQARLLEPFGTRAHPVDLVAERAERITQALALGDAVFDDEDLRLHAPRRRRR